MKNQSIACAALFFLLLSFWLDDPVRSFLFSQQAVWANTLMEWASRYGKGHPLALLCAIVLVLGLLLGRKKWVETGQASLCALAVAALSVQILKHLFGRARPRLLDQDVAFAGPSISAGVAGLDSFPSGHAASTFALAVVLARVYPGAAAALYAGASVISFSRLYLGAHFLSDALGGVLVGLWIGHFIVSRAPTIFDLNERAQDRAKAFAEASAILVFAVLLIFYNLKSAPLFDVDEGVFAEATREMVETGNLLTPSYNYFPRYDKPILIYWLMALAFTVLGANEFAARFWSALAGCGIVMLTFIFARAVTSLRVAMLTALILATNLEVLILTHLAITDMVLTFFIAASLFGFFLAVHQKEPRRQTLWALVAWGAAAGAALTKGPIGIFLPFSIVLAFLYLSAGGREGIRRLKIIAGAALFCALALPWYIAASVMTDGDFLRAFVVDHNVRRFLSVNSGHDGPWFYYLLVIALGFLPWTAFLPASLLSAWKRKIDNKQEPSENLPLFLLLWIFVVIMFFSLSRTKLPNYVAPLFPALSLLVGWWLDRSLSGQEEEKRLRFSGFLGGIVGLILAVSLAALPFVLSTMHLSLPSLSGFAASLDLDTIPYFLAATAGIAAAGFFIVLKSKKRLEGVGLIVFGAVLFSFALFDRIIPNAGIYLQEPLRMLAQSASERLEKPRSPLIVFGLNNPSILFYAKRPAVVIGEDDFPKLRQYLSQSQRRLVITQLKLAERIPQDMTVYTIERRGPYVLLSNRRPE